MLPSNIPRRDRLPQVLSSALVLIILKSIIATAQPIHTAGRMWTDSFASDTSVRYGHLSNGLSYYIQQNHQPDNQIEIRLVVKAGLIHEENDERGFAHLIEHLACRQTTHFPQLKEYLAERGIIMGTGFNAQTGAGYTLYEITIPSSNDSLLSDCLNILRDWLDSVTLTSDNIAAETSIIRAESRLRGHTTIYDLRRQHSGAIFGQTKWVRRFSEAVTGEIQPPRPDVVAKFYKRWYRPNLMAVAVVGDIDAVSVEVKIKSLFQTNERSLGPPVNMPKTFRHSQKPKVILVRDDDLAVPYITVYATQPRMPGDSGITSARSLFAQIFNEILASRLDEIKTHNPLAFQNATCLYKEQILQSDNMRAGVECEVELSPGSSVKDVLGLFYTELNRIRQNGFTAEEIAKAETAVRKHLLDPTRQTSASLIRNYTHQFLDNITMSPDCSPEVEMLSQSAVNAHARHLLENANTAVALYLPRRLGTQLSHQKIRRWIATWERDKLDSFHYQQTIVPTLLPGRLKTHDNVAYIETRLDSIAAWNIQLDNGARLILKPLKAKGFRSDKLTLFAFKPGGASLYNHDDYITALNAADIVQYSGVTSLSKSQIGALAKVRHVRIDPFISERQAGLLASCDKNDPEIMFQLSNLFLTEPQVTEEGFQLWRNSKNASFHAQTSPSAEFAATIDSVINGPEKYRAQAYSLTQIKLSDALQIYRETFGSLNGFTFLIIGDFEKDEILPLALEYLGTIKQATDAGRKETSAQITPKPVKIFAGSADKAKVAIIFHGHCIVNPQTRIELETLTQLLESIFMGRLREQEGAVYTVSANLTRLESETFGLRIDFETSVTDANRMIEVTLKEIDNLRRHRPNQAELTKAISLTKDQIETNLQNNNYWFQYFLRQLENQRDLSEIGQYKTIANAMSADRIEAAIGAYLKDENLHVFILMPAKQSKK